MKKTILLLAIITLCLSSCYKDIIGKCGVVQSSSVYNGRTYMTVRFDDGTIKKNFEVNPATFIHFGPGERICFE